MIRITGEIDTEGVDRAVRDFELIQKRFGSIITKAHQVAVKNAKDQLRRRTPRRSGRTQAGWAHQTKGDRSEIFNDEEPWRYLKYGTGIYGPHRTLIRPASGRIFVFEKEGRTVKTRWSRGQPPQNIIDDFNDKDVEDAAERSILSDVDRELGGSAG